MLNWVLAYFTLGLLFRILIGVGAIVLLAKFYKDLIAWVKKEVG